MGSAKIFGFHIFENPSKLSHCFLFCNCSNNRSFFFTEADKAQLNRIQIAVCSMRDLRQLFLLLIRHYNPVIQTRQYLNDVICANHVLLVLIENTDIGTNIMTSHLQQ